MKDFLGLPGKVPQGLGRLLLFHVDCLGGGFGLRDLPSILLARSLLGGLGPLLGLWLLSPWISPWWISRPLPPGAELSDL